MADGKVLVAGGVNGDFDIGTTFLDSAELYIPLAAAPKLQFSTSRYSVVKTVAALRSVSLVSVIFPRSKRGLFNIGRHGFAAGRLHHFIRYTAFAPEEENKTFPIPILDDGYVEGGESVLITLSNPNGAALGESSTAVLTITDNDTGLPVRNPTWVSTGNLNTARHFHTATLLPGGKVLVAGGYAGTSSS